MIIKAHAEIVFIVLGFVFNQLINFSIKQLSKKITTVSPEYLVPDLI